MIKQRLMILMVLAMLTGGIIPIPSYAARLPASTKAPLQFGACDGDNPATYNPAYITIARSTSVWRRNIELRYHTASRCAWGRITNGTAGDEIWVDRSFDGGRTWQPKLGYARINRGYTQKYTVMFDDRRVLMRACGKAGNRREIACTVWY